MSSAARVCVHACEDKYRTAPIPLGDLQPEKGYYLICDGGYHRWVCLMSAAKWSIDDDMLKWGKRLDSVRKDVECTFGRVKRRFRVLRHATLLRVTFTPPAPPRPPPPA